MPTALPFEDVEKIVTITVLLAVIAINLWLARNASDHRAGAVWRDHPRLMWSSMVFIALFVMFLAVDLAVQWGVLAQASQEAAIPVVGIPVGLVALWVIVEGLRVGYAILVGRR